MESTQAAPSTPPLKRPVTPSSPPSHYRTLIPSSPSRSTSAVSPSSALLSVRIVNADTYLCAPIPGIDPTHSTFRYNTPIKQLPLVRLYGSTPAGQKTLLHVHGVFPYVYVPFEKEFKRQFVPEETDDANSASLNLLLVRIANSIDKALNITLGRGSGCNDQHVFRIVVVRGKAFYGYHPEEEEFLKIYLFNPTMSKKLSDLLLAGAIMNRSFQPHETHVPFLLQFFIDYNLYGMNFIHLAFVQFRPFLEAESSPYSCLVDSLTELNTQRSSQPGWWNASSTPEKFMLPQGCPMAKRQGRCQIEADAVAVDIMNRKELEANAAGDNPGLAALWEDEKERRRNNDESSFLQTQFSNDSSRLKDPEKFKSNSDRFYLSKLSAKFEQVTPTQSTKECQPLASQVLDHREETASEPTSVDQSEPLVDEMSILEVVTQSSRGRAAASEIMNRTQSGVETIVDILADLVRGSGDDVEGDCDDDDDDDDGRLVNEGGPDDEEDDERETLEMTQVWVPPYIENEDETEADNEVQDGQPC